MRADASIRKVAATVAIGLALAACAGSSGRHGGPGANGYAHSRGYFKVGSPYKVNGMCFYPGVDYDYDETGTASWYGEALNESPPANGDFFDLNQASGAQKTLQRPGAP